MKIDVKDNYEIHYPPSRLAALVSKEGGKSLEDMIADAERDLARLIDDFPHLVGNSVAVMREGLASIDSDEAGGLHEIFREAFDIRGQAATLHYSFLGDLGQSLCRLTDNVAAVDEERLELIKVFIDAIAWAATNQVQDGNEPEAAELRANLDKTLHDYNARP